VIGIWLTERASDVAALGCLWLLAGDRWLAGALAAAALAAGLAALRTRVRGSALRELSGGRAVAVLAATSLFAWALPVAGLWLALRDLGAPIGAGAAAEIFSVGSLLGGLSLLPLGSGVTGSSMIVQLGEAGVERETAVAAVLIFRAGTSWYALGLGLVALVRWRRQLVAFVLDRPGPDHFDRIAAEYGDQIPPHVRERVVGRKVAVMAERLAAAGVGPGARGLEIGCGHGWYAAEMARRGYRVFACDRSRGQLGAARGFLAGAGAAAGAAGLTSADARALPFADASFDFAWAVNVLHHIPGPGGAERALREVVRVLRPGGSFFLHEINTENPLFAFYMGYVFPLLREIDDGTERWIRPSALPRVPGADWEPQTAYLTFLPDFVPSPLLERLGRLERALERSRVRTWSAHYVARLVKR
jgi:SAM-dependent methyltransferase